LEASAPSWSAPLAAARERAWWSVLLTFCGRAVGETLGRLVPRVALAAHEVTLCPTLAESWVMLS
jgi:hypothetical protein